MRPLRSRYLAVSTLTLLLVACDRTGDAASPDGSVASDASADAVATDTSWSADGPSDAMVGTLPAVPVGADAFRAWDRWPVISIGARTYMRSTYDRAGGNENADAAHFLRAESSQHVPLDLVGLGELHFVRTNRWHGSPWHYRVDGHDVTVSETSTATPDAPVAGSTFLPATPFPPPLALTWSTTQGADLSWVPIGFRSSFTLGYERTFYGTGYYIYSLYADDAPLSSPLVSWDGITAPAADVVALLAHAGDDVAPTGAGITTENGAVDVPATDAVALWQHTGAATIRALKLRVAKADALSFENAHVRITWDNRAAPSVDAPAALLFGAGSLFNRANSEWLVRSFPATIRFDTPVSGPGGDVELALYFPMPFNSGARIELVGAGTAVKNIRFEVRTAPLDAAGVDARWQGLFHATYRDHGTPHKGVDLTLLDTTKDEAAGGDGAWCGSFIGTSFIFSDNAQLGTLEGDPRFYFDDSLSAQAYGTGTEEWGGGGNYWSGHTTTLAFAGHPVGAVSPAAADPRNPSEDSIESVYRWLLTDRFPFGRNARITFEHGGEDDSVEHYRTIAYWYGRPGACLVQSDSLHPSDDADERAHAYSASNRDGTPVSIDTVTSRYEWGVDHVGAIEMFPTTTESGRHHAGTSTFTLKLPTNNLGALLRRRLDYSYANQRADVFVSEDRDGAPFERVGAWFLAGGNTCVFDPVASETSPPADVIQTSNRRLREDELLLPRRVTAGRSAIRIKIVQIPTGLPLRPGDTPAPEAWSELRYTLYAYLAPP